MTEQRLRELLAHFARARVLVVGDFFLDKYLVLDAALTETSIETGLAAYQVTGKRCSPGAAGNVAANLRTLGAGTVTALGMRGLDGEGYELEQALQAIGVGTEMLFPFADCVTPTYMKPMLWRDGVEQELSRLDSKNHHACPATIEAKILACLRAQVGQYDAVVVADQVQEANCGVITDAVREEVMRLAAAHPAVLYIADSRLRINAYRHLAIKPNRAEVCFGMGIPAEQSVSLEELARLGVALAQRNGRPAFITLAEEGILAVDAAAVLVPTLRQTGPIDICGAGDSTLAGITLALCSGATPTEAAIVGNLVASITVQQIGVTGAATPAQVLARFGADGAQFTPRALAPA